MEVFQRSKELTNEFVNHELITVRALYKRFSRWDDDFSDLIYFLHYCTLVYPILGSINERDTPYIWREILKSCAYDARGSYTAIELKRPTLGLNTKEDCINYLKWVGNNPHVYMGPYTSLI